MADFQARDYRIFETSNLCALIFFPRVLRNSYNDSIFSEDRDHETQEKVKQRMRKVNDVVGKMVRELMG